MLVIPDNTVLYLARSFQAKLHNVSPFPAILHIAMPFQATLYTARTFKAILYTERPFQAILCTARPLRAILYTAWLFQAILQTSSLFQAMLFVYLCNVHAYKHSGCTAVLYAQLLVNNKKLRVHTRISSQRKLLSAVWGINAYLISWD